MTRTTKRVNYNLVGDRVESFVDRLSIISASKFGLQSPHAADLACDFSNINIESPEHVNIRKVRIFFLTVVIVSAEPLKRSPILLLFHTLYYVCSFFTSAKCLYHIGYGRKNSPLTDRIKGKDM